MQLVDKNRDYAQVDLDLPSIPVRHTGRIWVVAPEPQDGIRQATSPDAHFHDRGLHVFFDAESGTPAFGPSDVLLFREAPWDGFRLLIPDAPHPTAGKERAFAARIEAVLARPGLLGVKGHSVRNIGCLSFPGDSVELDTRPFARTRLERALTRLMPSAPVHPHVALHESRTAEQLLRGNAHRAIEAYLRESQADALRELERGTGGETYAARAARLYDQAARDFVRAGLVAIARYASGAAKELLDSRQLPLPGLVPDDAPCRSSDPPRPAMLMPVMGFAIDIPELTFDGMPPARAIGLARYRATRRLQLNDGDLCRLVNPLTSPSRRVIATVRPTGKGLSIEAGHADAMRALLRLSSARPDCSGVAGVDFDCDTLTFDRNDLRVTSPCPVRVHAVPCAAGPHDVSLRIHMERGETASLSFRIPERMGTELNYA